MATPIPTNRAPFTANEIALVAGGERIGADVDVDGVVTDTRAIQKGMAFVALKGDSFDGHSFVSKAGDAGAVLAVVQRGVELSSSTIPLVVVDDTLVAWGKIAREHMRRWRKKKTGPRVLALTGSAGKTTTKELAAALLSRVGNTHRTAGNLNNRIGLPAVALELTADHSFAVLEMGMSVPGEIAALCEIGEPDVALITNIGLAHAEGVGGKAGVAREKGAIFESLREGGLAIVNADDDEVMKQLSRTNSLPIYFGRAANADYRLIDRTSRGALGSTLVLKTPGARDEWSLDFPLSGEANAIDFVAALAAAEALSNHRFSAVEAIEALKTVQIDGRSAILRLADGLIVIDDTYNANPQSMRAAFSILQEVAGTARKVAILGEMRELGPIGEAEHVALGDALAQAHVDLVIGCGGLMDHALARASARGVRVVAAVSNVEAAEIAAREVKPNDCVLVKGSRGVRTEVVVEKLKALHGNAGDAT